MSNPTLIFDIETVGVDFDSLDPVSREYIEKYAETDQELAEAKDRLSFSPLTGTIAAIGVLNPETKKGNIFIAAPDAKLPKEIQSGVVLKVGTEKQILQDFWEVAKHYHHFVSFNGRSFDVPFLMVRSAILDVQPTKNLMANRYISSQPASAVHVDLLDQLTFYGAVRKKFNLHFWCRAFNIPSPKESGITGEDVGMLMEEGRYTDMAEYNLGDLISTMMLYEKWQKYLSFDQPI